MSNYFYKKGCNCSKGLKHIFLNQIFEEIETGGLEIKAAARKYGNPTQQLTLGCEDTVTLIGRTKPTNLYQRVQNRN